MKSYTIIVKTLSKHMSIIILQFWVKKVVFEEKQFHLSNPLVFWRNKSKGYRKKSLKFKEIRVSGAKLFLWIKFHSRGDWNECIYFTQFVHWYFIMQFRPFARSLLEYKLHVISIHKFMIWALLQPKHHKSNSVNIVHTLVSDAKIKQ